MASIKRVPVQTANPPQIEYDEAEDNLLVSNILDNFEDIDPEEKSMFMNLNIRNRR